MKKNLIMLLGGLSLLGATTYGAEIIPEYYLMERLLINLEQSHTYISKDSSKELKAIQLNNEILKKLNTNENPIYVYDSDGNQKLVRKGDYFVAPTRLSSIYVMEKDKFENGYRDETLPEKNIGTVIESDDNKVNPTDVDEGSMDIKEIAQ
ncbi:hypothetical protein IX317_000701 [Fusobacterium sp. DD29]|uniref:hypothetical protein n=1 Tax=unclassified Fusobacterium TaxID=2648384 RepID=UPI001B8C8880|nr:MULTISPECIES: hypothetical protein [unclassified Fusobacterium]MBR8701253.1 hypothetical protein [Fusobacterium sp. DD45]MBR8711021.1 hypothetical protein [Fusobacterium sp. DD28]MBR8749040.1 hypothetical protein [Fusobacterium sp. DD29]MBR8751595.1 hypothetical protein [Fusobacterium sp. DD26]MBR8761306.1 hypothetical protein [Fusobacterium sp. DD25]